MSGWEPSKPKPCVHPGRSHHPFFTDQGRVWHCTDCDRRFKVECVDYGHDVMPGEPATECFWKEEAKR
jgi:hypothetical protein